MPLRFSSSVLTATATAIPSPVVYLDANDPASYPGSGTTVTDLSGNNYTHTLTGATYTVLNGVKCFDCTTGTKRVVVNGTGPTLPTSGYTYITWARLEAGDPASFRTLLYTNSPRYTPITIPNGTNTLGYWDTEFRSSGYDLASAVGVWVQYAVVGDNSSQTFYINGSQAGNSIAYGAGGTTHFGWGANHTIGQPWGYVANMFLYTTKLTQEQIQQIYDENKARFGLVTSNLVLRLDPDLASSYSGSGSTWTDIAGTADNITLVNSPTYTSGTPSYFTFNGSNQYGSGTTTGVVNSTAYTKSAWFYLNGYQDNNIFSGDGHFIYMGNQASIDKKIYCGHADWPLFTAYPSTATINLSTWYNVTLTFSTTNGMTLYINGAQDSTYTVRKTAVPGTRTANIAAYSTGNLLNGRVGKVLCYSAELTAGEVLQNFNADKSTYGL
jgi:hypothetical protein